MERPKFSPYTETPAMNPAMIFPNHNLQILSSVLNLLGITAVTYCFARRTVYEDLGTIRGWLNLSWPRFCVISVFFNSWAFIFTAGVLISGAGMSRNIVTCSLGVYSCIVWYALSKIFIYAFLIEKVWIVWSSGNATGLGRRLASPMYRVCICTMLPYFAILVLMIFGKIAELRDHDGVCVIGLRRIASLSLLTFDLFITLFLTVLFVWPLWSSNLISPRLRKVAARTLVASFVALATSTINIAVLSYMHGRQLGWICLSSCGADVTVNAVVLFWVTAGTSIKLSDVAGGVTAANSGLVGLPISSEPELEARMHEQLTPSKPENCLSGVSGGGRDPLFRRPEEPILGQTPMKKYVDKLDLSSDYLPETDLVGRMVQSTPLVPFGLHSAQKARSSSLRIDHPLSDVHATTPPLNQFKFGITEGSLSADHRAISPPGSKPANPNVNKGHSTLPPDQALSGLITRTSTRGSGPSNGAKEILRNVGGFFGLPRQRREDIQGNPQNLSVQVMGAMEGDVNRPVHKDKSGSMTSASTPTSSRACSQEGPRPSPSQANAAATVERSGPAPRFVNDVRSGPPTRHPITPSENK